jgi:hypothetical protein
MPSRDPAIDHAIELRPVNVPSSDDAYRGYVIASLALAVLVGFALGIHLPVTRLMDSGRPERTADLIQSHGQVQLLGFAGLYVMGMSLRLAPRFSGAKVAFAGLVPVILWLVVLSLVLRSVLMPWLYGDAHDAAFIASAFGLLIASACFLMVIFCTVSIDATRVDSSSLTFVLGAVLLFAGLMIATFAAIRAIAGGMRGLPYLADNAVLQLELSGFLLSFILGVSSRALPAMVGLSRSRTSTKVAVVALTGTVIVLAVSLLYLEYGSDSDSAVYLACLSFAALGAVFLHIVWLTGILRPAANRIRPASRPHLWLLRSAFVWLAIAGLTAICAGITGAWHGVLPTQPQFDAVRHALAVGVVTQMLAGMSLMIVPEFAIERQRANRQRLLALFLVLLFNVAAALRVLPPLAGAKLSDDERNLLMAIAGSCAEIAMIIFALSLVRLIRSGRFPSQYLT